MHISGAAISKKIAKYDAYFAQLLKERLNNGDRMEEFK